MLPIKVEDYKAMILFIQELADSLSYVQTETQNKAASRLNEFNNLKHKFAVQEYVENFVNEVPVMQINEVAGNVYSLI